MHFAHFDDNAVFEEYSDNFDVLIFDEGLLCFEHFEYFEHFGRFDIEVVLYMLLAELYILDIDIDYFLLSEEGSESLERDNFEHSFCYFDIDLVNIFIATFSPVGI